MGSIQAFPKRARPLARVASWREEGLPARGPIRVRTARLEDFAVLHALCRRASPDACPSVRELEARRLAFPEGQLVAERAGEVVGAASALVVDWERFAAKPRWSAVTGEGHFSTHEPSALTLFTAQVVVEPRRRGSGIGRALHQAYRLACHRMNLQRILVAMPLPGYAAMKDMLSPERFAMRLVMGDLPDPALRFHLAQGFQFCGVLRDFLDDADERANGHAALLAWINPAFVPPKPPALEEGRARRCA